MEQRRLAGTGLDASRVIFGTMTFGEKVEESEAADMVAACVDAGVTMFDTANSYNAGAAEEILGRVVKPYRDDVLIATKAFRPVDGPDAGGLSARALNNAIDHSLRRLDMDHVDLYYLHMPDWEVPIEETLGAVESLIQAGKVRYGACSNYAAWQMCEMLWIGEREGWQPLKVAQQMYNLIARRIEDEYAAFAERFGISTVAYNPLAGGLLTGKHRFEDTPEEQSRFARQMYQDRYWSRRQFEAVDALREIAEDAGMTLVELSYRWLLSRPLTDHMLLGASSLDQLRTNLDALEGAPPDADTAARCDDVWATLSAGAPRYNR